MRRAYAAKLSVTISTYIYVVDRDFGFAPNPFHGCCTLATCKADIRARARTGDWVLGMGGTRLKATGRCVYAMRVGETLSFDQYWKDRRYRDKRPVRNGSRIMLVGDNIYHRDPISGEWMQEDSHHSRKDGSPNPENITRDTKADRVLVSRHFYYFGREAPEVPASILDEMGYRNVRNYRIFRGTASAPLLQWLEKKNCGSLNLLTADPFDFGKSALRYSPQGNRVY